MGISFRGLPSPFIVLLAVAAQSGHVAAQTPSTYFVAVDGSDASSGVIEQLFASLTHALTLAQPGDTVYVRGGTYQSSETIRIDQSGIDSNRIHVLTIQANRLFSTLGPAGLSAGRCADRFQIAVIGCGHRVTSLSVSNHTKNALNPFTKSLTFHRSLFKINR